VVVGGPGSGKSTVAAALAERLGARHVELDELWWDPGWTPAGREKLRQRLSYRLAADRWVVDGNYIDEVADLAWPGADAIVWLDLPRRVAIRRAVLRSTRRALSVEECREQIRHLVRVRVHRPRGQELEMRAKSPGPCFRDAGWVTLIAAVTHDQDLGAQAATPDRWE
jgi:adenylate kinase family enzyme